MLAQRQMDPTQSKEGAAAGSKVVVAGDKWDWQSLDPLHPILHSALQSPTWRFSSLRQQNSQWVWGFSSEETLEVLLDAIVAIFASLLPVLYQG